MGSALGAGVGFKAGAGLLAPTLGGGSLLAPTTIGLKSLGATLAPTLGGAGSSLLTGGAGSLLTGGGGSLLGGGGGALLGGGLPAGFGGVGLKAGVGSLIPAGFQVPGGAGLKSLAMANSPLAGGSKLVGQAGNISNQMYDQLVQQFGRSGLGQNLPQVGSKLAGPAGPVDSLAFKPVIKEAPFLNTLREGAAIPGVTSNLPGATFGNVAGGPAIPGVTSGLPVGTTQVPLVAGSTTPIEAGASFLQNFGNLVKNPSMQGLKDYVGEHPYASAGAAYMAYNALKPKPKQPVQDKGMIRPYEFEYNPNMAAYGGDTIGDTSERTYFNPTFTELEPYKAAEGGLMALAVGGPVETMSAMNAVGGNMMYPQSQLQTPLYSNPLVQRPEAVNVISPSGGPAVGAYTGEQKFASGGDTKEPKMEGEYKYSYDPKTFTMTQLSAPRYADTTNKNLPALYTGPKTAGGIAPPVGGPGIAALMPQAQRTPLNIPAYQTPEQQLGLTDFYAMMNRKLGQMGGYAEGGGVSDLGGYSDGGRLLKGPGDGVSDSIPAVIGNRQPARLADGEFVVPARIVSELGNGSTEAGARKLYAMMDRVQKARRKTVGKNRVAANTKADKHLPA
jgi:hypothetical protein